MNELEYTDIQGIVLSGYGHLPHAAYLLLRFSPEARRDGRGLSEALGATAAEVTDAAPLPRERRPPEALNLALTLPGLRALGLSDAAAETFPPEFRGGMNEPYRARALGDVDENAPGLWEWGGGAETLPDLLLLCYAEDAERLEALVERMRRRWTPDLASVLAEERSFPHFRYEHFGFRDDVTSVPIAGGYGKGGGREIKAGEFLLGYENEYGLLADAPDLGRNGTYLVFRKLEQNVPAFWRYCREQAGELASYVAAKMVGRWPEGTPLAVHPHAPPPGEIPKEEIDRFKFAEDPRGLRCPIGAHVRRANPRDALSGLDAATSETVVSRHRIVRRGRPYGTPHPDPASGAPDDVRRGILFFCVNADIARQFEFVQQTWLNDPKFGRLWDEPDPITGNVENITGAAPDGAAFTIPQAPLRVRLPGVPRFVRVRAGAYFFLPGIAALRRLCTRGEPNS